MRKSASYIKIIVFGSALAAMYAASSCGVNVGNPDDDEEDEQKLSDQTDLSLELITTQYDETLAAATDYLRFVRHAAMDDATDNPLYNGEGVVASCTTAAEGNITVEKSVNTASSHARERGGREVLFTRSITGSNSAVWTNGGNAVTCDDDTQNAIIDWTQVTTLNLAMNFSETGSHTATDTNTGETVRNGTFRREGGNSIQWEKVDSAATEGFSLRQTTVFATETDRVSEKGSKDKRGLTYASRVETQAEQPIVTAIDFDSESKWITRTVESGTVVALQSNGSRVESTYSSVVFQNDANCLPVSGSITGKIFDRETAVEAAATFTMAFTTDGLVVTFSDGRQASLEPDECSFGRRKPPGSNPPRP